VSCEIPSSASGDAGVEGFTVETPAGLLGRVAAVNRTEAGLVLLVDTEGTVRAVPVEAVERVELRPRRILLADESEWPAVAARVVRVESPRLVRYVPRELDRVTVEGTATPGLRASPVWLFGVALFTIGGVMLFVGASLAIEGAGGGPSWLWVVVPGIVTLVGAALLWRGLSTGPGSGLSARERVALAGSFVLGISPPERRR
jgi:hypothetical protein